MRVVRALIACAVGVVTLGFLTASTLDCGTDCGNTQCQPGEFAVDALRCIASVETDCGYAVVEHCKVDGGSGAAAGSFATVVAPPDGRTCDVTTVLDDGTTISVQVHWVVFSPKNQCCPAWYQAEPPSLHIGASDAGAQAD